MLTADSERVDEDLDVAGASPNGAAQEGAPQPQAENTCAENGNACSNCHQPLPEKKTTVCPHCGYYFSLGICIELDQRWERLAGGQAYEASKSQEQAGSKSWIRELVPAWGWKLIDAIRRRSS